MLTASKINNIYLAIFKKIKINTIKIHMRKIPNKAWMRVGLGGVSRLRACCGQAIAQPELPAHLGKEGKVCSVRGNFKQNTVP